MPISPRRCAGSIGTELLNPSSRRSRQMEDFIADRLHYPAAFSCTLREEVAHIGEAGRASRRSVARVEAITKAGTGSNRAGGFWRYRHGPVLLV